MPSALIVDDDPDIRELIAVRLGLAGFEAYTEADGETGLAAAEELLPDVIVLDWMMPRLSGLEVCQRLRATPRTARIPVLLLTAKAQEADLTRGFAVGADDYLTKPFSPRELLARVQAVLDRRSPGR